jgi:hypothetical protein
MESSELEFFLIKFNELKKETNNSPNSLKWLLAEKPHVNKICADIYEIYERISEIQIKSDNKVIITPNNFYNYLKEFEEKWKIVVKEGRSKYMEGLL